MGGGGEFSGIAPKLDAAQRENLFHRLDYLADSVHLRFSRIDKGYYMGYLAALVELGIITDSEYKVCVREMERIGGYGG